MHAKNNDEKNQKIVNMNISRMNIQNTKIKHNTNILSIQVKMASIKLPVYMTCVEHKICQKKISSSRIYDQKNEK